jgi:hypothetical protein
VVVWEEKHAHGHVSVWLEQWIWKVGGWRWFWWKMVAAVVVVAVVVDRDDRGVHV